MTQRSLTLVAPLLAVLTVACRSDVGLEPVLRPAATVARVLTTLEVAPASSVLVQGSVQALKLKASDQLGAVMHDSLGGDWVGYATYVSSAPKIAKVDRFGLVTALAPGTTTITASLTVGDRTVAAPMTTQVDPITVTSVTLTANPDGTWTPRTASIKAGGTVTWSDPDGVRIGAILLNVWDDNAEKLEFVGGVATHTFSTPGSFYYGTGGGFMWYEEGGRVQVFEP